MGVQLILRRARRETFIFSSDLGRIIRFAPGYNEFMPIHDWTRVSAGTFHAFHVAWIGELQRVLNGGLLPSGYYASAEQVTHGHNIDVLTIPSAVPGWREEVGAFRGISAAEAPPRLFIRDSLGEAMLLAARRQRIVIHDMTASRAVALIDILSPGNKQSRRELNSFVDTVVSAIKTGYHPLLLDLFPPGKFDPEGIHGSVWEQLGGTYNPPPGKPLTLAAYAAATIVNCYVEPTAVGAELIPMPLFLDPGHYIYVPLEPTYLGAYEGVPGRWKRVIEGTA